MFVSYGNIIVIINYSKTVIHLIYVRKQNIPFFGGSYLALSLTLWFMVIQCGISSSWLVFSTRN